MIQYLILYNITPMQPQLEGIARPGLHDTLLGRGGKINCHPGNLKFHSLVASYKSGYNDAPRGKKAGIAREVVTKWRSMDPPGRFLARMEKTTADAKNEAGEQRCEEESNGDGSGGRREKKKQKDIQSLWYVVGEEKAHEKTMHCLRERDQKRGGVEDCEKDAKTKTAPTRGAEATDNDPKIEQGTKMTEHGTDDRMEEKNAAASFVKDCLYTNER